MSYPLFPLSHLLQNNLTELKSFGSPVVAVTNVTAAVMVLTAPGGKVPKDRSWKAAKVMMAKVDGFLDSLINFNKENIPEACLKAIQPYLQVSLSVLILYSGAASAAWQVPLISPKFSRGVTVMTVARYGCRASK